MQSLCMGRVNFVGGPFDGTVEDAHANDETAATFVIGAYFQEGETALGKRFWAERDDDSEAYRYRIAAARESDGLPIVDCTYDGAVVAK